MNARKTQSKKSGGRSGGSRNRNRSRKKKKVDPAKLWGDSSKLPTPDGFAIDSTEPLAVVHSLGRAPLPGVVAEPYFAAVYDRAAGLAVVLSDAAGLDDLSPPETHGSDPDQQPNEGPVSDEEE